MIKTSDVGSIFAENMEKARRDITLMSKDTLRFLLQSGWTSEDIARQRNFTLEQVTAYIKNLGLSVFEKSFRERNPHLDYTTLRKMSLLEEMTGHAEGVCQHCGVKPGLEGLSFHHVEFRKDGPYKELGNTSLHRRPLGVMEEEKEVCCVLCHLCHATFHKGMANDSYPIPDSLRYVGTTTYHVHLAKNENITNPLLRKYLRNAPTPRHAIVQGGNAEPVFPSVGRKRNASRRMNHLRAVPA